IKMKIYELPNWLINSQYINNLKESCNNCDINDIDIPIPFKLKYNINVNNLKDAKLIFKHCNYFFIDLPYTFYNWCLRSDINLKLILKYLNKHTINDLKIRYKIKYFKE